MNEQLHELIAHACDTATTNYLDAVAHADRTRTDGATQELLDSPYLMEAAAICNLRIAWLCPDCGPGTVDETRTVCSHPQAPSVADCIAVQEAVLRIDTNLDDVRIVRLDGEQHYTPGDLTLALRNVKAQ